MKYGTIAKGAKKMTVMFGEQQHMTVRILMASLLAALASAHASAQGTYQLELDLALRQSPRADAPIALYYPAGSTVGASTVIDAAGWFLVTDPQGQAIGYVRETDLIAPAKSNDTPPAATSRSSALGAFLTGGHPSAPAQTPVEMTAEITGPSRLGAFLSGPASNQSGSGSGTLSFASLADGQLKAAQASHEAEQRRLEAIRRAEWEAAEAFRRAEEAAYEAEMEIQRMEDEQRREEERQRKAAGDQVIADAMFMAAMSIGQAAADSIAADYSRMQAESQRRIADANRRAAELELQRARENSDQVRRDAQAEADRAQREYEALTQRQSTTTSVDYLGQAQARRAAEAEFQRRQAASAQTFTGLLSSGGSTQPSTSSGDRASGSGTTNVGAFVINYHSVGEGSGTRRMSNLDVSVSIRRVNVNGEKSEICANLYNPMMADWSGGYRVTDRSDNTTFATTRVASGSTVSQCEILPAVRSYNVVLRQD